MRCWQPWQPENPFSWDLEDWEDDEGPEPVPAAPAGDETLTVKQILALAEEQGIPLKAWKLRKAIDDKVFPGAGRRQIGKGPACWTLPRSEVLAWLERMEEYEQEEGAD